MPDKVTFSPSVLLADGRTYTPTGKEWLLAFAFNGCDWAVDALMKLERREIATRYQSAVDYPAR